MKNSIFKPLIDQFGCAILDGGLATQLEARGFDLKHPLWSGHILDLHPEAIKEVHMSYLKSGAQILLTSSYQLSFQGARKLGMGESQLIELLERSIAMAQRARDQYVKEEQIEYYNQKILIGGSIGPYGAYLADGSEYTGDYGLSVQDLIDFHAQRYRFFDQSGVDFVLFETIPSIREVKAINALVNIDSQKEVALSLSCRNERQINDGTMIEKCADEVASNSKITAVGVNCIDPEYGVSLLRKLRSRLPSKIIMIYPNSGEHFSTQTRSWSGEDASENFVLQAKMWKLAGARLIGGCCRITPSHIAALHEALVGSNQH